MPLHVREAAGLIRDHARRAQMIVHDPIHLARAASLHLYFTHHQILRTGQLHTHTSARAINRFQDRQN